ncbi:MAG: hypothetical protein PWQ08_366 [Clostridiales bacterium]|jgi:copper chaperone CopZ|nr:cation transporter [Pygmaiobacter sp.]MDK2813111.1 hypothetical protein [Clostridiales bacterium]
MKKTFQMEDLDCASCAAKMEDAIKKIDGVTSATVNFMTQKLTLEADDSRFGEIAKEAAKICRKVEPDCTVRF